MDNLLASITNNKVGVEIGGPSGTGTIIYKNANTIDNVIFSNNTVWSNHTNEYNYFENKKGKVIINDAVNINMVKNNVYDFSTLEGIKEAKELKTKANKFVKELKDFCEPLEADGKKIANARSAITTKLATGKDAVRSELRGIAPRTYLPCLEATSLMVLVFSVPATSHSSAGL